jgi:hypothetical protein
MYAVSCDMYSRHVLFDTVREECKWKIFGPESKEASNYGYYLMRNFCFDSGLWVVRKFMIYTEHSNVVKLRKLQ